MAARLKSAVLRREEKGLGTISMARLIAAGMIGGFVFMAMQIMGFTFLMIPGGLLSFSLGLILSAPRHGIPLYRHLAVTWLTRLLLLAQAHPQTWVAQLIPFLPVSSEQLLLDTTLLFAAPLLAEESVFDAWEILPDAAYDTGFEFINDV